MIYMKNLEHDIMILMSPKDYHTRTVQKEHSPYVNDGHVYIVPRNETVTIVKSKEQYDAQILRLRRQLGKKRQSRYITRFRKLLGAL